MKIIGFTDIPFQRENASSPAEAGGVRGVEMVLKGDSCLLNNRKPFFVPDGTDDVCWKACVVLRVSRLGKNIQPRFASRYYDAAAPGADFYAADLLSEARTSGSSWTEAMCFDFSLAMGEYGPAECLPEDLCIAADEAVHRASRCTTIRQGDLIYIHRTQPAQKAVREQVITEGSAANPTLYCKIK